MISTILTFLRNPGVLECARRQGGSTLLETSFGVDRIEAAAAGIPDPIYHRWIRAGDLVMPTFLASWACLFVALPILLVQAGRTSDPLQLAPAIRSFQSGIAHGPALAADHWLVASLGSSLGFSAGLLALGLAVGYLALWGLFLGALVFSVPHEFGHVVAMVKNGARLEGYGLVLAGLIPVGLYVRPTTDGPGSAGDAAGIDRQIAAAGVVNDTILATVFGAVALVCYVLLSPTLGRVLLVLAGAWIVSAVANSCPVSGLDGGQYLSELYRDSWLCGRVRVVDPNRLDF